MASNPLFSQCLLVALVLICVLLHVGLSDNPPRVLHAPLEPHRPRRRRPKEPKPFTGLIHQPLCEACELGADTRPKTSGSPPPLITFTREAARARSTPTRTFALPPVVPTGVGSAVAIFAPMAIPVVRPGTSSSASLAADIFMRSTARSSTVSAHRRS